MGLELKAVSKRYADLEVLHPTSLDVANGEFLTLLGPSGSGKTTVLRLIGGFTQASGGRICFDGMDITALPANQRPFNTVFQDYALFPHMTVLQNVNYGPLVQKRQSAAVRRLIDETIEIVGLSDLRDRFPAQLSGGQRQRVALARAIVCEPKVILLDEPLAALDAALRKQMQVFLKQIQRRIRTTFVFVTHDQDEAIAMSDRIVVMADGKIQQIGTPRQLYFEPQTRFVAGFFGENNQILGMVADEKHIDTAVGRLEVRKHSFAPGCRVVVAIRPETFRIGEGSPGIRTEVAEILFGGPFTKLQLRPRNAPMMKLDVRMTGADQSTIPARGEGLTVTYDPADAIVIAE